MKWLQLVLQITSLIPAVVQNVEVIAAGADGSTKKDLAMQSLGLGSAVAATVAPQYQPEIQAATQLASATIDNVVGFYNFIGKFTKKSDAQTTKVVPALVPEGGTITISVPPATNSDNVVSGGFSSH